MTISDSQKNYNSFGIILARGASLKTIKTQIKEFGCHYRTAKNQWSCPISQKSEVEELFSQKGIKATLKDCLDDYFDKTEWGKKTEDKYVRIDILDKEYFDKDRQLLVDKKLLDDEIQKRNLSKSNPLVLEKFREFEEREQAQQVLKEEIEQLRNSARLLNNQDKDSIEWPEPRPIMAELLPVQFFNAEKLLPYELRDFVCDEADRMPCPPDFIAATLIVALGSVIGAQCTIKPKSQDDWAIIPNLWGGIVGLPSAKKSPAIDAATKPLERVIAEAREKHALSLKEYETDKIVFEAQREGIESRLKLTAKKQSTDLENIAKELSEHKQQAPQSPIPRRFKSNDTTVEKLGELLKENPSGLLIIRDELVGLWASWDKSGREGERSFYLEAWNGSSSFNTDRIARGSIYIPNLCASLFGGIQPDKLTLYLDQTANSLANDGLLQRFQLLVYPDCCPWEWRDRAPKIDAREQIYKIFHNIGNDHFDPIALGASPKDKYNKFPYFHFDEEAQKIFIEWCKLLHEKLETEDNPLIQQHLAKYEKLFPALSLIFHLVECAQGKKEGSVTASSAIRAAAWCDYLESHARRCYGLLADDGLRAAQVLSNKILKNRIQSGFTLRDVRRFQWRFLTTDTAIESALDWLEDEGWLRSYECGGTGPGSGRPTTRYLINPKILIQNFKTHEGILFENEI